MIVNTPQFDDYPWNMRLTTPTAPDELPYESDWTSRMQFPAPCKGVLLERAVMVFLCCLGLSTLLFFMDIPDQELFRNAKFLQTLLPLTTLLAIILGGQFWSESSVIKQALLGIVAITVTTFHFAWFSFEFQLALSAFGIAVLIDRFFVHGVLVRSTAPHSENIQDRFRRFVMSRFFSIPGVPGAAANIWLPVIGFVLTQGLIRHFIPPRHPISCLLCQVAFCGLCLFNTSRLFARILSTVPPHLRRHTLFSEFKSAVDSFLYYNGYASAHPFLFRSPAGSFRARQFLLLAAIMLTLPIILAQTFFVPADFVQLRRDAVREFHDTQVLLSTPDAPKLIAIGFLLWSGFSLLSGLLTVLMPFLLCFAACAGVFYRLTIEGFPNPVDSVLTTRNWGPLVDHIRAVDQGKWKHHLLLGIHAHFGYPILIPREVLREHFHILGDTGCGKTSLGISPIIDQCSTFGDCSVVVFDLKGDDMTLAEVMRSAARTTSGLPQDTTVDSALWDYPFRYFHPNPDRPCHSFNPFQQRCMRQMSDIQRAEVVVQSMGLYYGNDYGRKYFSDANSQRVLDIFREFPQARSFEELRSLLRSHSGTQDRGRGEARGENVDSSVNRLAEIAALNQLPPSGEDPCPLSRIDLMDIFERPQALFLSLPAATGNSSNEDIARIFLYMLIEAAQRSPKPRRQVIVVIDEFQRIVAPNIGNIMQIARSHDIALILANQSLGDLKALCGGVVYSAVTGNTRIRQHFSLRDAAEVDELVRNSGERVLYVPSFHTSRTTVDGQLVDLKGVTYSPQLSTKLRRNDIIEAANHPYRSICHVFRSTKPAQTLGYPYVLEGVHHISRKEHERRSNLPWPDPTFSTSLIIPNPLVSELQQKTSVQNQTAEPPVQRPDETRDDSPVAAAESPTPHFHRSPANDPEPNPAVEAFRKKLDRFRNSSGGPRSSDGH